MKQFIIILNGNITIDICCDNFIKHDNSIIFKKNSEYISSIFIKDILKIFNYQDGKKIQIKL